MGCASDNCIVVSRFQAVAVWNPISHRLRSSDGATHEKRSDDMVSRATGLMNVFLTCKSIGKELELWNMGDRNRRKGSDLKSV